MIFKCTLLIALVTSHAIAFAQASTWFDQEVRNYDYVIPIGDIEGTFEHFQTLVKSGTIGWNSVTGHYDLLDSRAIIIFNGDYMRRGPYGAHVVKWILDLKSRYPRRINVSIGNHDGNVLGFLQANPALEIEFNNAQSGFLSPMSQAFHEYLRQKGLPNTLANRLLWWAATNGLANKIENYWLELVAEKLGFDPSISELKARHFLSADGQTVDLQQLGHYMSSDEMAAHFYEFIDPTAASGNDFWNLLKTAVIEGSIVTHDQVGHSIVHRYFHSGVSTIDNFGTVPGSGGRFAQVHASDRLLHADKSPAENFQLSLQALESFKQTDLLRIERILGSLKAPELSLAAREALILELEHIELVRYMDAQWDPVAKKMNFRTDSLIYPNPSITKDNSLPAVPPPEVQAAEARAGINITYGGHKPVGDVAVIQLGFDPGTQRHMLYYFHDTSYSPVEGNNQARVYADGSIRVFARTRDNIDVVIERPNDFILKKWLASAEPDKVRVAKRYMKLNMVVGGFHIAGFVGKKLPDGKLVADLDNYLLVQQVGYNFVYRVVDIYGIEAAEQATGGLKYPESDLAKMYQDAFAERRQMIESHGKKFFSAEQFSSILSGRNVYFSSGPADSSLGQVLDQTAGSPERVRNYLSAWRHFLEQIPADESWVFVGGGTTGLEQKKNAVLQNVNAQRRQSGGKPFVVFGMITGVTGGYELCPYTQNYILTPNTFYWTDYFQNAMSLIQHSNPKSIHVEFAGGGGIVGNQINQAQQIVGHDARVQVSIVEGISVKDPLKSSASDRAISRFQSEGLPHGFSILGASASGFTRLSGPPVIQLHEDCKTTLLNPRSARVPDGIIWVM